MDEETLRKGAIAINWEQQYRQPDGFFTSKNCPFLLSENCLDTDFEKTIKNLDLANCKVLDIGTGTGDQAIYLAKKKFDVTGIDVSATAIRLAKEKASNSQLDIKFLEDNILACQLKEKFDLIIDRGCLTLIPDQYKPDYFISLKQLLKNDGYFFIKGDRGKNKLDKYISENNLEVCTKEDSYYYDQNKKLIKAIFWVIKKAYRSS